MRNSFRYHISEDVQTKFLKGKEECFLGHHLCALFRHKFFIPVLRGGRRTTNRPPPSAKKYLSPCLCACKTVLHNLYPLASRKIPILACKPWPLVGNFDHFFHLTFEFLYSLLQAYYEKYYFFKKRKKYPLKVEISMRNPRPQMLEFAFNLFINPRGSNKIIGQCALNWDILS